MIPIVIILALAGLLQTTLLPVDLILLALIARAFIVDEKENYWLAFSFGVLVAILSGLPLGALSLIYLFSVLFVKAVRKAQFASNPVIVLPLSFLLIIITQLLENVFFGIALNIGLVASETVLVLPVYLVLKFWEERFIPRKEIKLKVGK